MGAMAIDPPAQPSETFYASRWTSGNRIFRTRITVTAEHVIRAKRHLFGLNEESIVMNKVASVHLDSGLFFADLVIESSGGTDPILSHGHWKSEAHRVRDLIEHYQASGAAQPRQTA